MTEKIMLKRSGFKNTGLMCEYEQDFVPTSLGVMTPKEIQYDNIKYYNYEYDMVDFITTGDVWKETGEPVFEARVCRVCYKTFYYDCLCRWETNGLWITKFNSLSECNLHKNFICFNCSKI
jgi:hypothetical protein